MPSLVVQTSFLGDTVLTTPLLARLAREGAVDVLVTPGAAPLLANQPAVRELIVYDKRGKDRGVRGFARLARALRARRYDAAYFAQGSVRSGALGLAAGIPRRVGFHSSAGRRFYTERVPYVEGTHHAARLYSLAVPGAATAPPAEALRPRLYPGEKERDAVSALLARAGHAGEPLVALAPGSVWPTKRWPYYPELARELVAAAAPWTAAIRFVIIGGKADAEAARAVADAVGAERVVDATGALSLLASAEMIARCRALVSNDSAPQHLASAVGTPTITVFGPTVPEFGFGPLAPGSQTVGHPALACRPCDRHGPPRCPLGHLNCMREIPVAEVARRLAPMLSTISTP